MLKKLQNKNIKCFTVNYWFIDFNFRINNFQNIQKKRTAEKQVAILEKQNAVEVCAVKLQAMCTMIWSQSYPPWIKCAATSDKWKHSRKRKTVAEKISLQSKEVITGMREIIWASNPANDNLKACSVSCANTLTAFLTELIFAR